MFEKNSTVPEENLFFAGVYQVVKIDSSMSNGQFLQTLTCVRLNNQNGLGVDADILASAGGQLTEALTDDYNKNSKRKLDLSVDKAREIVIKSGINRIKDILD